MGKQAVSLLQGMGYTNVRHYVGGMAEWLETGGLTTSLATTVALTQPRRNTVNPPKRRRPLFNWLDVLANWSLEQLVYFWIAIIVCLERFTGSPALAWVGDSRLETKW